MLKIDVEGNEATLLGAAEAFLRRVPPEIILFESNVETTPFPDRDLVRLIHSLVYDIFQMEMGVGEPRAVPVSLNGAGTERSADFVALKRGPRINDDLKRLNGQ